MNWPALGVLIPTFQRHDIVARTVELLNEHLHYPGRIEIIVSEDGPNLPFIGLDNVRVVKGPGRGLGANLNSLIALGNYDVMLQGDDDNWLTAPLVLDEHVRFLLEEPLAGWIRLQYVANHNFRATLREHYWWIDWDSPELYITSNKVHLKHRRFHAAFGMYPENLNLAETENNFCHQCKRIAKNAGRHAQVLVPVNVQTETLWRHVGDSWQKKGL
jgi:hypothetical protein